MRPSPARVRAAFASVWDHFHADPSRIAGLTDHQLYALAFHKRDRHGAIEVAEDEPGAGAEPAKPATLEESLAGLEALGRTFRMKPADLEAARAKLIAKHQRQEKELDDATAAEPTRDASAGPG